MGAAGRIEKCPEIFINIATSVLLPWSAGPYGVIGYAWDRHLEEGLLRVHEVPRDLMVRLEGEVKRASLGGAEIPKGGAHRAGQIRRLEGLAFQSHSAPRRFLVRPLAIKNCLVDIPTCVRRLYVPVHRWRKNGSILNRGLGDFRKRLLPQGSLRNSVSVSRLGDYTRQEGRNCS